MPNERVKEYAFLLLKYRLRSEAELYRRLKQKKFLDEEIKEALLFLKEKKFIDDKVFVKAWISSRLGRSFGLKRISRELKIKGVPRDVLEEGIEQAKKGYCESRIIEELARDRLARIKDVGLPKARNRTYAYLLRRGFSPEVVMDTLNKICKQMF
ncbi:MAG: regulatory protein RecX [Candidatus Omnitrophota bacterium]